MRDHLLTMPPYPPDHRGVRLLAAALVAVATVAVLLAAGRGTTARAASHALPAKVAARRLPADRGPFTRAGTRVPAARLGQRDFIDARDGFALFSNKSDGGSTYPVDTTDGGRIWRVDGPHLHVDAADGPAAVGAIGVAAPRTFFAYGGPAGGQAVDVSTDLGGVWYQAFLPGAPEAVVAEGGGQLVAYLQGQPTAVYVSTDGGRAWRLRG